jgi:hypothetical protein
MRRKSLPVRINHDGGITVSQGPRCELLDVLLRMDSHEIRKQSHAFSRDSRGNGLTSKR